MKIDRQEGVFCVRVRCVCIRARVRASECLDVVCMCVWMGGWGGG